MTAERTLHVGQGEHRVSGDPRTVLSTVLGSCVAACLYDPEAKVGGMNHFLLPEGGAAARYGAHAMELLINSLMKAGARRDRLEAKLFGGGRMFDGMPDVGTANADFALAFLEREGVRVAACSLGGAGGRRVRFWPASGRAMQRPVTDAPPPSRLPLAASASGELELFA